MAGSVELGQLNRPPPPPPPPPAAAAAATPPQQIYLVSGITVGVKGPRPAGSVPSRCGGWKASGSSSADTGSLPLSRPRPALGGTVVFHETDLCG